MSTEVTVEVNSILDSIKKTHTSCPQSQVTSQEKKNKKQTKTNKSTDNIDIRGKPKSGRFWKSKKERFATVNVTKGLKQDFRKKTALRLELKRTRELSKQFKEQLKEKELSRKERRRENLKRTEENKKKAEVVQVITNTAKLKRMKKKQLRFIEKRDTTKSSNTNT